VTAAGIGWGMVVVSGLVSIYYNMIIGWAIYYLIASFFEIPQGTLPWSRCVPGYASECEYSRGSMRISLAAFRQRV